MATPLDQQLQNIVFNFQIATDGTSAEATVQNTNPDLEIYGGDVRIFDEDGEIIEAARLDQFEIEIQANEKSSISNETFDARTLKTMLNSEKFPGFVLGKDAKTKITVTHAYQGVTPVGDKPFNIRIVWFGKVVA